MMMGDCVYYNFISFTSKMASKRRENSISTKSKSGGGVLISFSDVVSDDMNKGNNTANTIIQQDQTENLLSSSLSVTYQGNSAELAISCKKLLKRDVNTKQKAILDILSFFAPSNNEGDIYNQYLLEFLPFFAFSLTKLVFDDSWQVRLGVANILIFIIDANRKALKPFMKDIIGPWWQLMSDPSCEVRNQYILAFNNAFPANRRPLVILNLKVSLLQHIMKLISIEPLNLKELTQCSEGDLQEKFERVIVSNLNGLVYFLSNVSPEQNRLLVGESPVECFSYKKLFESDGILLKLSKSTFPLIRKAVYKLCIEILGIIPEAAFTSIESLRQLVLKALDESFMSNIEESLQFLIQASSKVPDIWNKQGFLNLVFQKYKAIKLLSSKLSDEFLLPFIGSLPTSSMSVFVDSGAEVSKQEAKIFKSVISLITGTIDEGETDDLACSLQSLTFLALRKPSKDQTELLKYSADRVDMVFDSLLKYLLLSVRKLILGSSDNESGPGRRNKVKKLALEDASNLQEVVVKVISLLQKNTFQTPHLSVDDWGSRIWSKLAEFLIKIDEEWLSLQLAASQERCRPPSYHFISIIALISFKDTEGTASPDELGSSLAGLSSVISQIANSWTERLFNSNLYVENVPIASQLGCLDLISKLEEVPSYKDTAISILGDILAGVERWLGATLREMSRTKQLLARSSPAMIIVQTLLSLTDKLSLERRLNALRSLFVAWSNNSQVKEVLLLFLIHVQNLAEWEWKGSETDIIRAFVKSSFENHTSKRTTSSSQSSDNHFAICFLVVSYGIRDLSEEIADRALQLWTKGNFGSATWFLLSLHAQSSSASSRYLLNDSKASIMISDWISEERYRFKDCLTQLFFSRDASADAAKSNADKDKYLGTLIVSSWRDIESSLFPHLNQNFIEGLFGNICQELNKKMLLGGDSAALCNDFREIPFPGPENPKVWASHADRLLYLIKSASAPIETPSYLDINTIPSQLLPVLFQVSFWQTLRKDFQRVDIANDSAKLTHTFACFVELLKLREKGTYNYICVDSIIREKSLFYVICAFCFEAVRSSSTAVHIPYAESLIELHAILSRAFGSMNNEDLRTVTRELLIEYSGNQSSNLDSDQEFLQDMIIRMHSFVKTPESVRMIRIASPLDVRDPPIGAAFNYIKKEEIEGGKESKLVVSSSVIQALHLENGIDHPYFTVQVQVDPKNYKVIQTEWWRLMDASLTHSGASGMDYTRNWDDKTEDSLLSRLSPAIDDPRHLLAIQSAMSLLSQRLSSSASSAVRQRDFYQELESSIQFICVCLSLPGNPAISDHFAPVLRGWILELTKLSDPHGVLLASYILRATSARFNGLGSVAWVPMLTHEFYEIISGDSNSAMSHRVRPAHDPVAAKALCIAFASILEAVSYNAAEFIVERKLIPIILNCLRGNSLEARKDGLLDEFINLLRCFWFRAGNRQAKPKAVGALVAETVDGRTSWEVESFSLVLDTLGECDGILNVRTEWNCFMAIHFCLLGRPRKSLENIVLSSNLRKRLHVYIKAACAVHLPMHSKKMALRDQLSLSTKRLTAAKLIDVWFACKGENPALTELLGERSATQSSSSDADSKPAKAQYSHSEEESERVNEEEEFLEELKKDHSAFIAVVGEDLELLLVDRFSYQSIMEHSSQSMEEDSLSLLAPMVDEMGEEESDSASVSMSLASPPLTPSSSSSIIGKKQRWKVMLSRDPLGSVFTWLACLQAVDSACAQSMNVRARCGNHLKTRGLFSEAMAFLMQLGGDLLKVKDVSGLFQRIGTLPSEISLPAFSPLSAQAKELRARMAAEEGCLQQLAVYALFRTICTFPALTRSFWSDDCTRVQKTKLSRFVEERVRSSIIRRETALIQIAQGLGRWKESEFEVKGNGQTGEITAIVHQDETQIEITIKMPASYPLKNVDVTCTSRIGVSDGRWRRWVLQMIQLLSLQDGSVIDAALLWKTNIDQELKGVEPCPICYCTIHTRTLRLPSLSCPTCHNKFHPNCLHTWFKTSGKSKCVLCQQPIFL